MPTAPAATPWSNQLLAALLLLACLGFMLWMLLGPSRQQRLRAWWQARRRGLGRRRTASAAAAPVSRATAEHEAQALIERARRRGSVQRDGNVLRPERFGQRPSGDDGHDGRDGDADDPQPPRPTLH
jgi:hypothetical protein